MPNYAMGVFLLPLELCKDLERMMSQFWWKSSTQKERGIHWMSWKRMCKPKECGGLGFRCLRSFNIALLGKQGWRLTTEPNSLVGQIFRARYYPRSNFISAKLGTNPSFVWRSIFEAQELVRRGVGWRVRSGRSINVLGEPWLPSAADPYVKSRHPALQLCKVSNLMKEDKGEWDKDIIYELFEEKEADIIMTIPLPSDGGDDNIYWKEEKNGVYSVRSAYQLQVRETDRGSEDNNGKFWRKLWKLKIPPKIKNMLWRSAANCLPTNVHLRGKHVNVNPLCIKCHLCNETTLHCLVECRFADECWRTAGFVHHGYDGASFAGWLWQQMCKLDDDGICRVASLCWAIWRARNERIWKRKDPSVNEVVVSAKIELDQWRSAKEKGTIPSLSTLEIGDGAEHWSKPKENKIKVNVDAATFTESGSFGVGWVARGADGKVIEARALELGGSVSPEVAEAIGVREALSWIKDKAWKEIIVESDCLVVVQAARSKVHMISYFGSYIAECRRLLSDLCCSIVFVRRSANGVAHLLARASPLLSGRVLYEGVLPSDIQAALLDDIANQ